MQRLILLILLLPRLAFSQTYLINTDSLRKIWYSTSDQVQDSTRFNCGITLIGYYKNSKLDSVLPWIHRVKALGVEKKNQHWVYQVQSQLAHYYILSSMKDSSLYVYKDIFNHANNHDLRFQAACGIGVLYYEEAKYDSALYYYQCALALSQKYNYLNINNKDKEYQVAVLYVDIAELYESTGKYLEAIEAYEQSEKIGAMTAIIFPLRKGLVFRKLGLMEESKVLFDESRKLQRTKKLLPLPTLRLLPLTIYLASSLSEIEKILKQADSIAEAVNTYRPLMSLNIRAGMIFQDSFKLDRARSCFQKSLDISLAQRAIPDVNTARLYLAQVDLLERKYTKSLHSCRELRPFFERSQSTEDLELLYSLMSQNFEALGRSDSALYYFKKGESVLNKANTAAALRYSISAYLKYRYEQDTRSLQNAKAYAENLTAASGARERLAYWLFGALTLFLGSIALFYFIYYRQKSQTALQLAVTNQALQSEQEKLRRSNKKLRHFSSVVSHDILSNLDLILSTGNILVNSNPQLPQLSQYYNLSQQTNRQLKNYCLNLLKEATLTQQHSSTTLQDPNPVLEAVLKHFDRLMHEKNMHITTERLAPLALPPVLMEQIFQNLISNALRYASEGPEPFLHFRSEHDESGRSYWIMEDNGPGIPATTIRSIEEGKAVNSQKGQGVGLVQLSASLREYGATLNVENRPEGGTRFMIGLC